MSEGKQMHTALPWVRDRASGFGCDIRAANGRRIAAVNVQNLARTREAIETQRRVNDANAVYIVTACNAFPALVEALKGAKVVIKMMERPDGMGDEVNAALDARLAKIDAALSAASTEGGQ